MKKEENEVIESQDSKITISSLLGALKKSFIVVCISAVLVAVLGAAYAMIKPNTKYYATAQYKVINDKVTSTVIDNSQAELIATDIVEMINTEYEAKKAVEKHNLAEYLNVSVDEAINIVCSSVSASKSDSESSMFTFRVVTNNKDRTFELTKALQDVVQYILTDIYKDANINAISTSLIPMNTTDTQSEVGTTERSAIKMAVIGAFAGAVISYLICFFLYITDTKVYDEGTIKSNFKAPVIGVIPEWTAPGSESTSARNKKRSILAGDKRDYKGKILGKNTPFAVTEAFNTLRTNLCYSTAAEKCPVFAVTSDFSGAGKSVISANLSASLAMLGKKTLLIECDLRRPELSEVFEINKSAGLSEFLTGVNKDIESVKSSVGFDNLDVVLSGRIPPNPSELLGSETMASFIEQCKENYDIIIIDTPPAYEVSDIGVISSMLTGIVLVARSNFSDVNAIKASQDLIEGVNGKIVGYVVNDVNFKSGSSYYRGKKYGYRAYRKYAKYSKYYSAYSADKSGEEKL